MSAGRSAAAPSPLFVPVPVNVHLSQQPAVVRPVRFRLRASLLRASLLPAADPHQRGRAAMSSGPGGGLS